MRPREGRLADKSNLEPIQVPSDVDSFNALWTGDGAAVAEFRSASPSTTDAYPASVSLSTHNVMNYAAWAVSSMREASRVSIVDLQSFNVVRNLTFDGPIWDVSWHDNFLLCGSSDGKASLSILGTENALPPQELICKGLENDELYLQQLSDGRVLVGDEATRVRCVSLHPRLENNPVLLCSQGSLIYLWNLAHLDAPTAIKRVSRDVVLAADWNPHSDSVFVIASQSGSIKIFDSRNPPRNYACVWRKQLAHKSPVRTIKWNPSVPQWVATGGEEGLVQLWDLRYGASSVCSVVGHTGPVNSIDWCTAHPDMLVSGGSDRALRICSFTFDDLDLMGSVLCRTLSDRVTHVGYTGAFSKDKCVAMTANGDIHTARFSATLFDAARQKIARCVSETEEDAAYGGGNSFSKLERLIYERELEPALKLGTQLLEHYAATHRSDEDLHKILQLCTPVTAKFTSPDDWNDSVPPSHQQANFAQRKAIKHARRIPYNYPMPNISDIMPAALTDRLKLYQLGRQVSKLSKTKQYSKLSAVKATLLKELNSNDAVFTSSIPQQLVSAIFSKNFEEGIELAMTLAKRFETANRWLEFMPVAAAVLSPTIFDSVSTSAPNSEETLRLLAQNLPPQTLADQFNLVRSFLKRQHSEEAPSDEDILELLSTHVEVFISLSAQINRAYLNALFRQEAWDAFYILATELAYKAKGFEFESYINEFMRDVVFPAFSRFLANCQEPKTKLSARRECIKRMLSLDINHTADVDISYVTSILPAVTKKLWKMIKKDLDKACRKDADRKRAISFAKDMLDDVEDIIAGKQFNTNALSEEVQKMLTDLHAIVS